jgi:hypothetical protein
MSIKLEHSVTAKCKPEHVWQKFQKLEEWPWWNRAIGQAKWIEGQPWQPGSRFMLELAYPKQMAFEPVVTENAAPQTVAWKGEGSGITGTMRFRFDAQADGSTLLKTEAEFSGWKTKFATDSIKQAIHKTFEEWLNALKTEAEKIAGEELAHS